MSYQSNRVSVLGILNKVGLDMLVYGDTWFLYEGPEYISISMAMVRDSKSHTESILWPGISEYTG